MAIKSKYAAIDIGSNAMRVAFANYYEDGTLTVFKNYRFPLRLGADAFTTGKLSKKSIERTEKAFSEILCKISKYNITKVKAMATSALRDCKNSNELIDTIEAETGINIEIIGGLTEAKLIKLAIGSLYSLTKKTSLLIDIGGGSTEVTLVKNNRIIFSKSYNYGTVRILKSLKNKDIEAKAQEFKSQVKRDLKSKLRNTHIDLCIGTGGNLRRMGKLRKLIFERPATQVTLTELTELQKYVESIPLKSRVKHLGMREDRADVIVPAMALIKSVLKELGISCIHLPRVGLKEGILIDCLPKRPSILHIPIN